MNIRLGANTSVSDNEVYGRVKLSGTPTRMPAETFKRKLKRPSVKGGKERSFLNTGKIKRD